MSADLSERDTSPSWAADAQEAAHAGSGLARLCSAPRDVFAEQFWARRPWLSSGAELPGELDGLFSAGAVDELLSRRGLRTPFLRLAKGGRLVPPARYTGSGGAGATITDQVHDDAVLRLFADGTTVVLQGVHRTWAPVGALAADLATDLGHPVQVNAYVTPPQSQGFASHYDTHDVFVLQVTGRKQWRIHEPVLVDPLPEEPWEQVGEAVRARAEEPPTIEAVLEPGDSLYLPRGFLHSANALGGTSIHLTFGIHAATERDVAAAALAQLGTRKRRASLPLGWDPTSEAGRSAITAVVADVMASLAELDPDDVASSMLTERTARQRPEPVSPLAQAELARSLHRDDAVRLRRHLGARLLPGRLELGGRRIDVDEKAVPAVERMLQGSAVTAAALPGLAETDALGLVRLLLSEGVVVPDVDHAR